MSGGDRLTAVQWRVLRLLATLDPPWTLTGGAALAGVHLKHRGTRDVDLFFRGQSQLGVLPREAEGRLLADGLSVEVVQSGVAFHRLRVGDGSETCLVDLVADPVPPVHPPVRLDVGGASILVDDRHELLVNKLCALVSRSELRDLVDVKALLEAGGDLDRALVDAPRKDSGFSPLVAAWLLREWKPRALGLSLGLSDAEAGELERFHHDLVLRLTAAGSPE